MAQAVDSTVWLEEDLKSLDWCCDYRLDRCFNIECTQIHLYEYCRDYMSTFTCSRGVKCNYMHVSKTEKALYLRHDRDILKIIVPEAIRSRQICGICKFHKYGQCKNGDACKKLHVSIRDTPVVECFICCNPMSTVMIFEKCKHCVCEECLPRLYGIEDTPHVSYYDINYQEEAFAFRCPFCKKQSKQCLKLRGKDQ